MNEECFSNLELTRKIVGNTDYFYELPPSKPRMFFFFNKKIAEEITKTGKEITQKLKTMRTEQRERTVVEKYNVYIAKDGKEFTDKNECENHEKILDGTRKVCPECNGKGKINEHYVDYFDGGMYGDHQYHTYLESDKCPKCGGKGYIEKKVVWE